MSTHRAFVIQFRPDADPEQGRWEGRIEHVASGRTTHFHSLEELLSFLSQMLPQRGPEPVPEEGMNAHQS